MGNLYGLRIACGLTARQAADLAGVHRVTWKRWETGRRPPPRWIWRLLDLYQVAGGLEFRGPFAGWRICPDGILYAPGIRRGFTAGEILSLPWLLQLVAALRADLRTRTAQASAPAGLPARILRLVTGPR